MKKITIKSKVLAYIDASKYAVPAIEIAQEFKIKKNHARSTLSKLLNEGRIVKDFRGYYRRLMEKDYMQHDFNRIMMHGIKLEAEAPLKDTPLLSAPFQYTKNLQRKWKFSFRNREAGILQGSNGKVQIWIKAGEIGEVNKNLDVHDYRAFLDVIEVMTNLNQQFLNLRLIQFGFNVDMKHIEMRKNGNSFVSAQTCANVWWNMYQKTNHITRLEAHAVVNMNAREIIDILRFVTEPPRQEKQLEGFSHEMIYR